MLDMYWQNSIVHACWFISPEQCSFTPVDNLQQVVRFLFLRVLITNSRVIYGSAVTTMRKMTSADVIIFQTLFRETQQSSYIIEVTERALLGPQLGASYSNFGPGGKTASQASVNRPGFTALPYAKVCHFCVFFYSVSSVNFGTNTPPSPSRNALGTPLSISVYFNFVKIPTTATSFSLYRFLILFRIIKFTV